MKAHELIGRGKVLAAFDQGDDAYLKEIALWRIRILASHQVHIYINVYKYFVELSSEEKRFPIDLCEVTVRRAGEI